MFGKDLNIFTHINNMRSTDKHSRKIFADSVDHEAGLKAFTLTAKGIAFNRNVHNANMRLIIANKSFSD